MEKSSASMLERSRAPQKRSCSPHDNRFSGDRGSLTAPLRPRSPARPPPPPPQFKVIECASAEPTSYFRNWCEIKKNFIHRRNDWTYRHGTWKNIKDAILQKWKSDANFNKCYPPSELLCAYAKMRQASEEALFSAKWIMYSEWQIDALSGKAKGACPMLPHVGGRPLLEDENQFWPPLKLNGNGGNNDNGNGDKTNCDKTRDFGIKNLASSSSRNESILGSVHAPIRIPDSNGDPVQTQFAFHGPTAPKLMQSTIVGPVRIPCQIFALGPGQASRQAYTPFDVPPAMRGLGQAPPQATEPAPPGDQVSKYPGPEKRETGVYFPNPGLPPLSFEQFMYFQKTMSHQHVQDQMSAQQSSHQPIVNQGIRGISASGQHILNSARGRVTKNTSPAGSARQLRQLRQPPQPRRPRQPKSAPKVVSCPVPVHEGPSGAQKPSVGVTRSEPIPKIQQEQQIQHVEPAGQTSPAPPVGSAPPGETVWPVVGGLDDSSAEEWWKAWINVDDGEIMGTLSGQEPGFSYQVMNSGEIVVGVSV